MKSPTIIRLLVLFVLSVGVYDVKAQCSIESNIVTNSDFQSGNTGFSSSYSQASDLHPEGKYDVSTNPNSNHGGFASCGDHTSGSGKMFVVNGATVAGVTVWCQTVTVTANSTYTFSTWIASVVSSNPAVLQFSINGVNLGSTFTASSTTCSWQQFCQTWNSGASTSANICIVNQNTVASGNDFALDDIQMGKTVVMGIDLSSFTAVNYEQGSHLKWTTSSEINHDYFMIERSYDLTNWIDLEKVEAEGGLNEMVEYEYFDSHLDLGSVIYYRLKCVDKAGKVDYSVVKCIQAPKSEVSISPNPTFDKVFIWGVNNVNTIEIFNSFEQEQKKFSFLEHPMPLELDLSDLKPGVYFIRIISDKENADVVRLVKR